MATHCSTNAQYTHNVGLCIWLQIYVILVTMISRSGKIQYINNKAKHLFDQICVAMFFWVCTHTIAVFLRNRTFFINCSPHDRPMPTGT